MVSLTKAFETPSAGSWKLVPLGTNLKMACMSEDRKCVKPCNMVSPQSNVSGYDQHRLAALADVHKRLRSLVRPPHRRRQPVIQDIRQVYSVRLRDARPPMESCSRRGSECLVKPGETQIVGVFDEVARRGLDAHLPRYRRLVERQDRIAAQVLDDDREEVGVAVQLHRARRRLGKVAKKGIREEVGRVEADLCFAQVKGLASYEDGVGIRVSTGLSGVDYCRVERHVGSDLSDSSVVWLAQPLYTEGQVP
jgi:hypothetical protein